MKKSKNSKTIVKSDLVDRVYERVGFTRQEAAEAVDIVLNEIKLGLARGENVRIPHFASFNLRNKNARNARNPRTGELIRIKPRRVLTFKPSRRLLYWTNLVPNETKNS